MSGWTSSEGLRSCLKLYHPAQSKPSHAKEWSSFSTAKFSGAARYSGRSCHGDKKRLPVLKPEA